MTTATIESDRPPPHQQQDLDWVREPARADWFWQRVLIGTDVEACWPWCGDEGTWLPTGHVRVWFPGGTRWLIHRLSYVLNGGELLDGELIRHRCPGDPTPSCVNPRHLSSGTALDNARDRDMAGRRTPLLPRGERHWSAALTQHDANRIRDARTLGVRADDAAAIWGISRSTVYAIWCGSRYAPHTPDAVDGLGPGAA